MGTRLGQYDDRMADPQAVASYRVQRKVKCCATCFKSKYDPDDTMYCYELMGEVSPKGICDEYDGGE